MHFEPEAVPAEIPSFMTTLIESVGWGEWQRHFRGLELAGQESRYHSRSLADRRWLELSLSEARRHHRNTGRYAWPPRNAEEYRLYSFLSTYARAYSRLTTRGKAALSGAVRRSMSDSNGFGALAHELRVLAHLMGQGFDVDCIDFEGKARFDFLAKLGNVEIEIECKFISPDIGRRLHQADVDNFSAIVETVHAQHPPRTGQIRHVQIEVADRLPKHRQQLHALKDLVQSTMASGSKVHTGPEFSISLEFRPFAGSLLDQKYADYRHLKSVLSAFMLAEFGLENTNTAAVISGGASASLFTIKSQKNDNVLLEILDHLKADARNQLSRQRPAALMVHFSALTPSELLALQRAQADVTGIQIVANRLLARRPHLALVALMTHGAVLEQKHRAPGDSKTSVREHGPTYLFTNPVNGPELSAVSNLFAPAMSQHQKLWET